MDSAQSSMSGKAPRRRRAVAATPAGPGSPRRLNFSAGASAGGSSVWEVIPMSSPGHDRAALAARARQITERELEAYGARKQEVPGCQHTHGQGAAPGCSVLVPVLRPLDPVVAGRAQGSWLEDVDGNRYVDFDVGYGTLLAGHGQSPDAQSDRGAARQRHAVRHALRAECRRSGAARRRTVRLRPACVREQRRRVDDGRAIRAARGYTGRSKIIKVEGELSAVITTR